MPGPLRAYFLGRLNLIQEEEAEDDRREIQKPPTAKSQSLLAYLIVNRARAVPRERLIGMFWGERPERRARQSLSTALWHIRRCFPEQEPLEADAHQAQFVHEPIWVDSEEFEAQAGLLDPLKLESALSLYQGEFLEGFYDDWIVDERYRLQESYLNVLARLMQGYENQQRFADALSLAQRLLQDNPLREDAHRMAMRAYCHLGQRNAALEQYALCERSVQEELGVEPMPETNDLFQAIQAGTFEIGGVTARPAAPPLLQKPSGRDPSDAALSFPFVGRDTELARLAAMWEQARSGTGGLLLIAGEAGVGKSRLVETFASHVRAEGSRVLAGRCYEFERLLPYQPIAEAVRSLAATLTAEDWEKLPGWVAGMISWLLPELVGRIPGMKSASAPPPEQDPTHVFEALAQFLSASIVRWPLLLLLEDLHWATDSTLQLLHYIARRLANSRLLIVGTYRRDGMAVDHQLASFQHQLEREDLGSTLELARLSPRAVARMLGEVSGLGDQGQPFARRLFLETEGNPFFLVEIIKSLFERQVLRLRSGAWQGDLDHLVAGDLPLPKTVAGVIQDRAARLGEESRQAIRLVAVLGREFDFDLFEAALEKGQEAALEIVESLLRQGLIVEGTGDLGRDYAFSHHKIQEVIYDSIPRRVVQHLHAVVAGAMERLFALEREDLAPELAHHFDQARLLDKILTPKAITYWRMAGETAARRFANAEAAGYLSRALEITAEADHQGQFELRMAREKIFHELGDRNAQAGELDVLEQIARSLSPRSQAEVALRRASLATVTGAYQAAIAACQSAIEFSESAGLPEIRASAHHQWGMACFHSGEFETANAQFEIALKLARQNDQGRLEADTLVGFSLVAWKQGAYARVTERAIQARSRYQEIDYKPGEGNVLNQLGIAARYQDQYSQARTHFEGALHIWQELGNRRGASMTLGNLGVVSMDLAAYSDARSFLERALRLRREMDDPESESNALGNLCVVSIKQGDFSAAQGFASQALQISRRIGNRQGEAINQCILGITQIGLGDLEGATSSLQGSLEISRQVHDRRYESISTSCLGQIALQQFRYPQAQEQFAYALALFQELGERAHEGETRMHLGRIAAQIGDLDQSIEFFEQALAILVDVKDVYRESDAAAHWALAYLIYRDFPSALETSDRALQIARKIAARELEANALMGVAGAQEGLGQSTQAAEAYRQAMALRREIKQDYLLPEARAGLARISLKQGDLTGAQAQSEKILLHLENRDLHGAVQPIRILLTCCQVLDAAEDPRRGPLLEKAHTLLAAQAAGIPHQGERRAFLDDVPAHRDLRAWRDSLR